MLPPLDEFRALRQNEDATLDRDDSKIRFHEGFDDADKPKDSVIFMEKI